MALFAIIFWGLALAILGIVLAVLGIAVFSAVGLTIVSSIVGAAAVVFVFLMRKKLQQATPPALRTTVIFIGVFTAVAVLHLTLLQLPYYWDEGGYYVPAALDFYHRWTLIPEFTNAHPPLPSVILGLLWHVVGYHIVATRLCAAAFAAAGLVAVFRIGERAIGVRAAAVVAVLTGMYPIWFAQSTLAHADIFAAAFSLTGFAAYFRLRDDARGPWLAAVLFTLAALSKETAIVEPATLAAVEFVLLARGRSRVPWLAGLSFPVLPLIGWFLYHRARTGFMFGNPEFLRYNATANFTVSHVFTALRYRFLHLFWQRNIWLPIVFAVACLLMPRRDGYLLPRRMLRVIAVLVVSNWVFFSVLGGALLTRYLLPIYPLILLACVAVWQDRTKQWGWLALATGIAFVSAWWINPPVSFAPEDNLTYRDMIVVHRDAAAYIESHYPHATVLTAWPVAADLTRPELGYVSKQIQVTSIDNFSAAQVLKAAQEPGNFDTALIFTTHYMSPTLQVYLKKHPGSARGREFAEDRDLTPAEVATVLHGRVEWQEDLGGEVAAVLRFDRQYQTSLEWTPQKPRM